MTDSPGSHVREYAIRAARVIGAAGTLIATSCVLLLWGALARFAPTPSTSATEPPIQSHHEEVGDGYVVITGHVSTYYYQVELIIDGQEITSTSPDDAGNFRLACAQQKALPKRVALRLQGDPIEVALPTESFTLRGTPPPPRLAFAYYLADHNLLWVAGTTTSPATLGIQATAPFPCGERLTSTLYRHEVPIRPDHLGAFDVVAECDAMPGSQMRLTQSDGAVSAWQAVQLVHGDQLPLARRTEIRVRDNGAEVSLEVTVPKNHPFFDQAVRAIRDPDGVVRPLFGFLFPHNSESGKTPVPVFEIEGDRRIYRLTYTQAYPPSFVGISPIWGSLGQYPLLTDRDQLQIDFQSHTPLSFPGLVPTSLTDGKAVWRGPLAGAPQDLQAVFTTEGLQDSARAQREPAKLVERPRIPEEKTLPDFIRSFEQTEGAVGAIAASAWRALLGLIPLLGLLWLSRRTFLGSVSGWTEFRAGLIVLAVWSSWPVLHTVVIHPLREGWWSLAPQLARVCTSVQLRDSIWAVRDQYELVFLIPFVVITAFLPAWARQVAAPASTGPTDPAPSRTYRAVVLVLLTGSAIAAAVPAARAIDVALHFDRATDAFTVWLGSKPNDRLGHTAELVNQLSWSLFLALCSVGLSAAAGMVSAIRGRRAPLHPGRSLFFAIALALTNLALTVGCICAVALLIGDRADSGWTEAARSIADLDTARDLPSRLSRDDVDAAVRLTLMVAVGLGGAVLVGTVRRWLGLLIGSLAVYFAFRSLPVVVTHVTIGKAFPHLVEIVNDESFKWLSGQTALFLGPSGVLGVLSFRTGLRAVVPASVKGRYILLAGVVLTGVSLFPFTLPARILLGVAAATITAAIGLVVRWSVAGLARPPAPSRDGSGRWGTGILLLIACVLALPFQNATEAELDLTQLVSFAHELRYLITYLPVVGLIVSLTRRPPQPSLREMRLIGTFFFAVVLVNPATTWMFVPLPFGLAILIAWYALFRTEDEIAKTRDQVKEAGASSEDAVRKFVAAIEIRRRLGAVYRTLADQFQKLTLTPAEYDQRVTDYRNYQQQHAAEEGGAADRARAVFAWGLPNRSQEGIIALIAGGVLAAGPFLLALYQYLPERKLYHPFAIAELLTLFGYAARTWLLAAFFIGYFMPYLRGKTGLAKGIWVFAALAVTYALDRLVAEQSMSAMKIVVAWSVQAFVFCSLLGLFVLDYRLIRRAGYGPRTLRDVHELPTLSAYGSTLLAAIVPAVTGIIAGGFGNAVKLLVDMLLPHAK